MEQRKHLIPLIKVNICSQHINLLARTHTKANFVILGVRSNRQIIVLCTNGLFYEC